ncbi:hypothetical protein FRACYDRAFT_271235 [Fragilariopsis cylindrus CCMP1102]|uniref:Uncharacterized protein n=1 Tax=Fragilariopsis cylindrus CCMP1102 TaxID=635003 RepID=A0A1E7EWH7_9STRA|nr:hypothetical protein FRACYDRAFT_271235 [Fragilariopsis cylindrus CCMP1102]|eukprot:OEU10216.1 hypothetical protein FRACYDRAFT_271235 [Fragilariopsis cylindrus CCMP1102]
MNMIVSSLKLYFVQNNDEHKEGFLEEPVRHIASIEIFMWYYENQRSQKYFLDKIVVSVLSEIGCSEFRFFYSSRIDLF